ncbi:NAD(P)/FAD-dependent oxidoreductase [Streptomyces sp. NPDC002913]
MSARIGRIVVVGAGIAGLTACHALRSAGYDGELTLVGEETHAPYSRPALSKTLHSTADVTAHQLPAPTHGATEVLGVRAEGLDAERGRVRLDSGEELGYDRLVIASGSRARRLGGAESGEMVLRTLDDALALRARLAGRPSVVVVGAGPLGMEIASGALTAGCEVTVVADRPPMLPHLGPYLSAVFTGAAQRRGLRITDGAAVGVTGGAGRPSVVLADGRTVAGDLVVTAAGDLPNVEWLAGTGLLRGGRLEADARGRVAPRIVAAGDVAAFPTKHGVRRIPLWSSAVEQAKAAAGALLHGDGAPALDFEPYFWTEQFGLTLKATGFLPVHGEPEFRVGDHPEGPAVMRWEQEDGSGVAVAVNHRIPIPRLRRTAATAT